jgi:hypothetical protein
VRFFHFLNSNSNFEFGPVRNRTEPEPVRIGRTGSHGFGPIPTVSGPVPTDSVNPDPNTAVDQISLSSGPTIDEIPSCL